MYKTSDAGQVLWGIFGPVITVIVIVAIVAAVGWAGLRYARLRLAKLLEEKAELRKIAERAERSAAARAAKASHELATFKSGTRRVGSDWGGNRAPWNAPSSLSFRDRSEKPAWATGVQSAVAAFPDAVAPADGAGFKDLFEVAKSTPESGYLMSKLRAASNGATASSMFGAPDNVSAATLLIADSLGIDTSKVDGLIRQIEQLAGQGHVTGQLEIPTDSGLKRRYTVGELASLIRAAQKTAGED